MTWLATAVIATMADTAILAFIYYYLYLQDRKKYLGIWAIGWSIYFVRFIFMLGMVTARENSFLLIGNQICSLISGFFLLWGTYEFIDKKFPVIWLYTTLIGISWIIYSILFKLTFLSTTLPTFIFLAIIYIWTGVLFLKSNATETKERSITGFIFIIWGIHKADYPFLRPLLWFAPWGYLLGAILEIIVALGLLLIYFKKTRNELSKSEKRYRFLSDASMEAIFFTKNGIGLESNQAAADMFGYNAPEEFIGRFGTEIIAPQSHEIVKKHMLKNLTDPYEAVGMKRDGTHFPIKIQSKTIRYTDNQLVRATSIMDVSDLKRKEKELHESEEKFRILYDLSPQSIALTNIRTGKLVNVNKKFSALTGYSKHELTSSTVTELGFYSDPDRDKFLAELEKSGEVQGLEMDFRAKNGSILNALMFAKLINIADEPLILTIFTDLTVFKKLESRLKQSQKMETIGTLAGGIAHDFNNILSPIVGHTEILLANPTIEDSFRASLKQILAGAVRASELVKQILAFSSHASDKLEPMKLEPVICEALKLIRSTIPTTIQISQDLQSACSVVKADPTQVHQIIMNLTTNAYHAMEETGGEIRVRFKEIQLGKHDLPYPDMQPGTYACLSIADTGIGMDKDISRKIFEPFFTTKKKGKGTGMGLSVVYGIVKSMGGSIQVYSEPEKGSEFKLYFPTEKKPFTEKQNHAQEETPGGTERILLVDDEEPIITMTKTMLELLGYHVTTRLNSIEALQSFRDCPNEFDLVITDMAMPAMSGDKLSIELTKIRPDIPILLCTGFSETMTEEKSASLGITGFLLKPIIMKDFSQKIREVLDKGLHQ